MACGLEHIAHLNLLLPREFLLKVEDELEAFVDAILAEALPQELTSEPAIASTFQPSVANEPLFVPDAKQEVEDEPREKRLLMMRLEFPPLARPFEDLLSSAATRFGLKLERCPPSDCSRDTLRSQHRRLRVGPLSGVAPCCAHPALSYADFLRLQRPLGRPDPPPPPYCGLSLSGHPFALHRLRSRLWAARLLCSLPGDTDLYAAGSPDEVRAALDTLFGRCDAQEDALCCGDIAIESCGQTSDRSAGGDEQRPSRSTSGAMVRCWQAKHCYARFRLNAPRRLYWRDDFAKAPWPTAKLRRRVDVTSVEWRPEWRVGPVECCEGGERGGVLSWAVQPSDYGFGEGFELSLRCGLDPEEPQQCDGDFVLSFRRGSREWHLTGGCRVRASSRGCPAKVISDPEDFTTRIPLPRQMFWVACVRSNTDGNNYVVVGSVPGLLTNHFFSARVSGQDAPISHAGFAYLPAPGHAAFGSEEFEKPSLMVESITVFPHGLTGELPFVSLRYVEERRRGNNLGGPQIADSGTDVALAVLVDVEEEDGLERDEDAPTSVVESANGGVKMEEESSRVVDADSKGQGCRGHRELVLRRVAQQSHALHSIPAQAGWLSASRRACGLPPLSIGGRRADSDAASAAYEAKLERRVRRRTMQLEVAAPGSLDAQRSWEPPSLETLGFERALRVKTE